MSHRLLTVIGPAVVLLALLPAAAPAQPGGVARWSEASTE